MESAARGERALRESALVEMESAARGTRAFVSHVGGHGAACRGSTESRREGAVLAIVVIRYGFLP